MKTVSSIFIGLFCLSMFFNPVQAQNMDNAGEYMSYFNELYKPIQKDMWDYTSSIAKGKKAKKVEARRKELMLTLSNAERTAARAQDWDGDAGLRDQVVEWLKTSQIILNEEYGKIMDLEEIAEQSYDNMEAYLLAQETASQHMTESNNALTLETKRFATENGVNLIEEDTRLGKKLEKANKTFDYYNDVYLLFFKSYKQDAYLTDACNRGDVNSIEQNKNTLGEYARQGREELRSIKSYDGDASLKLAADQCLQHYVEVADKHAQTLLDFYLKKEKFDAVKASFEAKKKSQRTQSDVDEYNKAINDYNAAINDFNATNELLNKTRAEVLNDWNKAADKFLQKHAT